MNFFPNIICLDNITEYTPDFLLNELLSIVVRFIILIVSLLGFFVNSISDCIELSLSSKNLSIFSALGTCKSAAYVTKSMCSSRLVHLVRCFKGSVPKGKYDLESSCLVIKLNLFQCVLYSLTHTGSHWLTIYESDFP